MTVVRTDAPEGAAAGWDDAFNAICDSHRGRLVRWLTAIFGPRDAEDIAQEALARLYVRPGLLDPDADAWPWLAVVARNVGRDIARHNAFTTAVDAETLDAFEDGGGGAVADAVVAREEARRLARALLTLTPRDRALIRLRDVEGVPVAEIAEQMGTNDNAVRQQLFRARRRLAGAYVALGGDRRPGLVALLGLKAREFLRRHGHLLNAAGPSSAGVLAAVAPAIAAVVAGALVLVTGGPDADHDASARLATIEAEPRHGTGGRTFALGPGRPGRDNPPPPPPNDPVWELDEEVGPVKATVTVHNDRWSSGPPGHKYMDMEVEVTLPTGHSVGVEYEEWSPSGNGLDWYCDQAPAVPCPFPTEEGRPAP